MKASRGLFLITVALVLSLLVLSFPDVGSSAQSPQKQTVIVTAKVTDETDAVVANANVSISQDNQYLGQGNTDARGIVKLEIAVNPGGPDLAFDISKAGRATFRHMMKLGRNLPPRLPLEEIQLKNSAFNQDEVVLTVKVVDEKGAPVKIAHVNVYLGRLQLVVKAPYDQQDTGIAGTVQFNIPRGKDNALTLEVSREDKKTVNKVVEFGPNSPSRLPPETIELTPREVKVLDGLPFVKIKVSVEDENGHDLPGALVRIDSGATGINNASRGQRHEDVTGADGTATVPAELTSLDSKPRFFVIVSKPGYKERTDYVDVDNRWGKANGQTVDGPTIGLTRKPNAIELKVTVRDGQTNLGVRGADVVVDGTDYATSTTDSDGVASISVDKPGDYVVRISQDYYWPTKDAPIRIVAGVPPSPVEFRMRRKSSKDAAEDSINITVLAKDSIDDTSPHPLKGAAVSDGNGTLYTDDKGQVTLRGSYQTAAQINVSANEYQTQNKKVSINKPLYGNATGSATFVLDPALSETTAIRLVVDVLDSAPPHNKLGNASAWLWLNNQMLEKAKKTTTGEPEFTLKDSSAMPLSGLRSGLKLVAKAPDYEVGESLISSALLVPSLETHRVTIFLRSNVTARRWDQIRRELAALKAKADALNTGNSTGKKFVDKATSELSEAQKLSDHLEAIAGNLTELTTFGSETICSRVAKFRQNLQLAQTEIANKATAIDKSLKDAAARAPRCSSPVEAESLRATYRQAIKDLGEMGKLRNQITKEQQNLSLLESKAFAAQRAYAQMKSDAVMLQTLALAARQNELEAKADYNRRDASYKTSLGTKPSLKENLAVIVMTFSPEEPVPADIGQSMVAIREALLTPDVAPTLEPIISTAPADIEKLEAKANKRLAEFKLCTVNAPDEAFQDTLALQEIDKSFEAASFNVGFANDLPKLADACLAKPISKNKQPATTTTNTSDKDDDPISVVNSPNNPNDKPVFTTPNPNKSSTTSDKSAESTTTSGGFWDAAKKSKGNVEDKIKNGSGQTNNSSTSTTATGSNTATNKSKTKPTNPALAVEDLPDDRRPTNATSSTNNSNSTSTNKNGNGSTSSNTGRNKPPISVEEIPETNPSVASNRPSSRSRTASPTVEEIPETTTNRSTGSSSSSTNTSDNKLPPGIKRGKDGKLYPKDGWEWVNPDDPNDKRVQKKPSDPNKPSKWEQIGGVILQGIAATQTANGGGSQAPPSDGNSGGRSGGGNTGNTSSGSTGTQSQEDPGDISGSYGSRFSNDERTIIYSMTVTRTSANEWRGDIQLISEDVSPCASRGSLGQNSGCGRITRDGARYSISFRYAPKGSFSLNPGFSTSDGRAVQYDGSSLSWTATEPGMSKFYRQ